MFLVSFVMVCALTGKTTAMWYTDLTSASGLELGDIIFRLEDMKIENETIGDKFALRVDYGNVWVSAIDCKDDDGIELEFFIKDENGNEG